MYAWNFNLVHTINILKFRKMDYYYMHYRLLGFSKNYRLWFQKLENYIAKMMINIKLYSEIWTITCIADSKAPNNWQYYKQFLSTVCTWFAYNHTIKKTTMCSSINAVTSSHITDKNMQLILTLVTATSVVWTASKLIVSEGFV